MLHTAGMRIYERLSQIYDIGWGAFAEHYLGLVGELLSAHGINQARILDLACGTGVLAMSLAHQGHIVHGIDISSAMVAVARSKSMGMPNVSFDVQDMTRFIVRDKFDLMTCTFDSVNYVADIGGIRTMFSRVARFLKKSGLFVFDSNTSQHYIDVGNGSRKTELGGHSFVHTWSYDPIKKEATTTFEFADGSREVHQQRPYDASELKPVLTELSLRVVHTWSGFDKSPYNTHSGRLFCVAQKTV